MKTGICGIILIALFGMAAPASAQVAVIGNKSIGTSAIDMAKLKNLYLLVSNELGGGKVKLFDINADSPAKDKFFDAIGKPAAEAKKIWLRAKLTGNGTPPEAVGSDEDMLAKIESTPGAIGYVSASRVTPKVKTLMIIN